MAGAVLAAALALVHGTALATDPASHDATVPANAGTVVLEWAGVVPAGASGQGSICVGAGVQEDPHTINLAVPNKAYEIVSVNANFRIEWDDVDQDLVLTVLHDGAEVGSSDNLTGITHEDVGTANPGAGTYEAIACPYTATADTPFRGRLVLTAKENLVCVAPQSMATANATQGLWTPDTPDAERPGLANFDVFSRERTLKNAPNAPVTGLGGRAQPALFDRTLGVPTFLWARDDAPVAAVGPLTEQQLLIARAKAHLRDEASHLKINSAMIEQAAIRDAQYNGKGPAVVRFQQRENGLEVFKRQLNVMLDRGGKPVATSGYFATDYDPAAVGALDFALSAPQAVAAAWVSLGGALDAAGLDLLDSQHGYDRYVPATELAGSHTWVSPARVKRVYYPRRGALEPAYFLEIMAAARANDQRVGYGMVVSAVDGRVLQRKDLFSHSTYSYRVFASTAGPIYQPLDSPLGNGYTPFTGSSPNAPIVRNGATANLITLAHAGIVTGDHWMADGAIATISNHVDACLDTTDTPASGVTSNPANTCNPELGDSRPAPNGPNTFDYPIVADTDPSTPDAQAAAVVNLFYVNNFLHDWWYNHGFNEAAGNAQTDNYGRGGLDLDPMLAQGQDASGRNNANMATPSDGASPTMQQYLFDGPPIGEVRVLTPADSGPLKWAAAAFGPDEYDITNVVALADDGSGVSPTDGCGEAPPDPTAPTPAAPPQASLLGAIALIDRGNCNFTSKAQFALASGAVAMIVVNNADGDPISMGNGDIPVNAGASPTDPAYEIASVMIRKADGEAIKGQLAGGEVTAHMQRSPAMDADGTLDNQIIAHENFHYVHNRLVDQVNNQGGAMGEGWGDIDAFMLSTRPSDTSVPGNEEFGGAYALAHYVTNNFWAGIRRAPYSTDFAKNAFTFKHIENGVPTPDGGPGTSNSEVHNAGEIWANMMWECYVGLLTDPRHDFATAQDRMQDYIIAGLKLTPPDTTYTEGRDAILAAVLANDREDYARCSHGFAKRGMGLNAVAPDRDDAEHLGVVESYAEFVVPNTAPSCTGRTPQSYALFGGAFGLGGLLLLAGLAGVRRFLPARRGLEYPPRN
jgi:hypothetical protein